jgi:hypothetical protein
MLVQDVIKVVSKFYLTYTAPPPGDNKQACKHNVNQKLNTNSPEMVSISYPIGVLQNTGYIIK